VPGGSSGGDEGAIRCGCKLARQSFGAGIKDLHIRAGNRATPVSATTPLIAPVAPPWPQVRVSA